MKGFTITETSFAPNMWRVDFLGHDLIGNILSGTYNAIAARLFGLTYPEYLRYVRENYNATIIGKKGYPFAAFKNAGDCNRLVKELNDRWAFIMAERTRRGLSNIEEII